MSNKTEQKEREIKEQKPAQTVSYSAITYCIGTLSPFQQQPEIAAIISTLNSLETERSSTKKDKIIETLRTKLRVFLAKPEEKRDDKHSAATLGNAIHQILLVLAYYSPENTECVITGEALEEHASVFSSDGCQFNISTLRHWHNKRNSRGLDSNLKEDHNDKLLLNPFTSQSFNNRDTAHIVNVAAARGITFRHLRPAKPLQDIYAQIQSCLQPNNLATPQNFACLPPQAQSAERLANSLICLQKANILNQATPG